MANPPPVRPWFRLASIRPASAPAPAPAPEARPVFARPVFTIPTFRSTSSAPPSPQTQPTKPREPTPPPPPPPQPQPEPRIAAAGRGSVPPSPDKRVVPAPSSSLPTSPIQKAPITNINTSSVSSSPPSRKPPSTSSSPKTIKAESVYNSPVLSPKLKPTAPPPSPLILPPSQLDSEPKIPKEAEQKTVLVQKSVEKPRHWLNGNGTELHREAGNHGKGKESETRERGAHKKVWPSDSEDSGMKVITIAGENRGAYMELVHSQKKHEANYLHKKGNGSKINGGVGGGESESSSNIEGSASRKDKNHKGRSTSSFPMAAYMNSNVQCVNNSLLFHASCSHHDPGVSLSLSKKPHGEGYHLKEGVDGQLLIQQPCLKHLMSHKVCRMCQ